MQNIEVVSYNPKWPQIFEVESALIREACGENCLEIHHIGSTSVLGLVAKPKIDMIIVVKESRLAREQLERIGIQYRGEYNIPLHSGFSKRGEVNLNLHVYEDSHPEIELNLCFRDYLRNHEQARDEYARLKQALLQDTSSFVKEDSAFTNYTLRKGDFIRKILKEAGFQRLRMLKCNDATEWAAARHFRDTYFFGPHGIEDPYTWTFHHESHAHLVLYEGCDIIGYAHIQFWQEKRCAIRIILVAEGKRNKKAGSTFLAMTEKWLKTLGIKSLHAESRLTSWGFYLQNDYTEMPFQDPEGYESDPHDIPVGKVL